MLISSSFAFASWFLKCFLRFSSSSQWSRCTFPSFSSTRLPVVVSQIVKCKHAFFQIIKLFWLKKIIFNCNILNRYKPTCIVSGSITFKLNFEVATEFYDFIGICHPTFLKTWKTNEMIDSGAKFQCNFNYKFFVKALFWCFNLHPLLLDWLPIHVHQTCEFDISTR